MIENLLNLCGESTGHMEKRDAGGVAQRKRCSFTPLQVHCLEQEFLFHRYISQGRRRQLAAALGMTQQQVWVAQQ